MTTPDLTASTSPDEASSGDLSLPLGLVALTKVAKALHDRGLRPDEIKAALKAALAQNRAKRSQATKT